MIIKQIDVGEWDKVEEIHKYLEADPQSHQYVYGSLEDLRGFFINSLSRPDVVGMLMALDKETPVGIATIMLHSSPLPTQIGIASYNTVFIHSGYVRKGFGYKAGKLLYRGIEDWGKARNAKAVFANIRPDGNLKGFERKYGLKPRHVVVMKEIE